jgi:hypothetical protein
MHVVIAGAVFGPVTTIFGLSGLLIVAAGVVVIAPISRVSGAQASAGTACELPEMQKVADVALDFDAVGSQPGAESALPHIQARIRNPWCAEDGRDRPGNGGKTGSCQCGRESASCKAITPQRISGVR